MEESVDNIRMRDLIRHEKQRLQETFDIRTTSFGDLLDVGPPDRQAAGQAVSNEGRQLLYRKSITTDVTGLHHTFENKNLRSEHCADSDIHDIFTEARKCTQAETADESSDMKNFDKLQD
jgi:hypothetical protein